MFFGRCKSIYDFKAKKGKIISDNYYLLDGKKVHFFDKKFACFLLKDFHEVKLRYSNSQHLTLLYGKVKSGFLEFYAMKK